jgi:hypothetical protein
MYITILVFLAGCEGAGYAISGAGQAISIINDFNDASDAYEEQLIADICENDPGFSICPGHCDVNPTGIGCPGFHNNFCDLFPDAESCT